MASPVTSGTFVDWSPVWSRDGRYLFFCSDRGGSPNLWRVRVDEETGRVLGPPELLTTPASSVMRVGFSADGSGVASEASGTRITPLAPDPENDRFPRWSRDVARIAFSSTKGDEGYEIDLIRPDGLDLRRHTFFKPAAVHFPPWSPDGRRIAFTEYITAGGRTYVVDADGPWPEEPLKPFLTPPQPLDLRYRPWSWSRDGRRIGLPPTGSGHDRVRSRHGRL